MSNAAYPTVSAEPKDPALFLFRQRYHPERLLPGIALFTFRLEPSLFESISVMLLRSWVSHIVVAHHFVVHIYTNI